MAHFEYAGIGANSTGIGVAFFFLLSGFLMARNHGKKVCDGQFDRKNFIARRLVKLYPLHILCLLAWLTLNLRTLSDAEGCGRTAVNALLLQSWIPVTDWYFSCNDVSWFLSDMLFLIFSFPLIYRFIGRLSKRGLFSFTALLMLVYITYMLVLRCDDLNYWLYICPPVRFFDFALGLSMWRAYQLWPGICRFRLPSLAEAVAIVAACASLLTYPLDPKWHVAFIHWLVLVPLILIFWQGETGGGAVSAVLRTRVPVWLGGLTMEIFMLHKMVISIVTGRFTRAGIELPYPAMLIVCIAATIIASYILQQMFVKPTTKRLLGITALKNNK